jgi:hypothetical protein
MELVRVCEMYILVFEKNYYGSREIKDRQFLPQGGAA